MSEPLSIATEPRAPAERAGSGSGSGSGSDPAAAASSSSAGRRHEAALETFVAGLGLDATWYARETEAAKKLKRYVRVNPRKTTVSKLLAKAAEGLVGAQAVEGCAGFLGLDGETRLKGVHAYEDGEVYGMDLASGLAVKALALKPGMSALDLCAAPGAKMCMMADEMEHKGLLVGVDASAHRSRTCASLLKKYRVAEKLENWQCMLVEADGVTFSHVEPLTIVWDNEADEMMCSAPPGGKRKRRLNKSGRRMLARRRLENGVADASTVSTAWEFDRVLVDAECTHDGSIKHMLKYAEGGFFGENALEEKFIGADLVKDSTGAQTLEELQRGLLLNGFRRLAPGGVLVYSTCSFSEAQNENIVRYLLEHAEFAPQARLEDLDACAMFQCASPLSSKSLPGTLRFTPTHSGTSGLFLAKISKQSKAT
ncbi:tRNA cytosine34-C5-methyltransferase [Hondaea fermentalgiana]|uniref:tRNA cytosine34-C5-methyltransferase n=1 Tax=Hondaea fermentalgiana TaxID=2315210 RepID=A0A2R5GCB7_9STRA|nr:tRNA cytosine34-C5-methyltransferase [Hondaea fermentalgiana]|eukprot:GBG25801.1 tRNA cytosine34-C5-methyltransferase [Hondaea fermentalgiana]